MSNTLKIVTLVLLVALAVAATGCGRLVDSAVEGAAERATGVSVDEENDSVTIKGKEGEVTFGDNAELPEGFPEEVPVYDGKITTSLKVPDGFSVGIETQDGAAEVFDWYKDALDTEGWTVKNELKVENGANITAENADWAFNMTAAVDEDEGKTTIVISVQERQK